MRILGDTLPRHSSCCCCSLFLVSFFFVFFCFCGWSSTELNVSAPSDLAIIDHFKGYSLWTVERPKKTHKISPVWLHRNLPCILLSLWDSNYEKEIGNLPKGETERELEKYIRSDYIILALLFALAVFNSHANIWFRWIRMTCEANWTITNASYRVSSSRELSWLVCFAKRNVNMTCVTDADVP